MPIATAQMNSKQFETRNFVFSPEIWIQKYAMKPQSQETVLSPHESRGELFGCRGDPLLRLAFVLVVRGAFAEAEPLRRRALERLRAAAGPRAPRHAHRGGQPGGGAAAAGEVQRGAAACCEQSRSCCTLWWEKFLGKICREKIVSELRQCKPSQIISNRFTKGILFGQGLRRGFFLFNFHFFRCELTRISSSMEVPNMDMSKFSDVCIEQMPCCKFQSEMSEAVKAF